jgi:predicted PurR-regulated permease PerM
MPSTEDRAFLRRALETSIRIGLTLFLVVWCFAIARPFLQPIVWGIILAIATQPIYAALCRAMGGRRSLAAAILVVGALLVLIVPSVLFTTSVAESTAQLAKEVEAGTLQVPPPPAGVADWPVVGGRVHAFWAAASQNLDTALEPLHPQLKAAGGWVLGRATSAGLGLLVFALSIVLAGVLLASGEPAADAWYQTAARNSSRSPTVPSRA